MGKNLLGYPCGKSFLRRLKAIIHQQGQALQIMFKKAVLLVTGNAFGFLLLLVRNLIVARLISPENYGVAASFAIIVSMVEMLSYIGLTQLIIVDKDGDEPHFQAAMHGFQALRGMVSAAVLYMIAGPYAAFLGISHVAWAYELLALVPLISGFQHYDPHRLRRHMKFTPTILSNSVPALISVVSVWPLTLFFGDYRIMLYALLVQAFVMVILSHLTAERRYQLAIDFSLMKKASIFGWPILLNAMLMFPAFNGEKLIVGRELGMAQFAYFSLCFTLTLTPTLVMASSCQSLFLPQLTKVRENREQFQKLSITVMEVGLLITVLMVVGATLVGGPLAYLLTGPKYASIESILSILVPMSVMQAIRVARSGSDLAALSVGQSTNSMAGTMVRVASIPISWWAVIKTGQVMPIIWIAMVAEVIGYFITVAMTGHRTKIQLGPIAWPSVLTALTCVAALIDVHYFPPEPGFFSHMHPTLLLVAACGIAAFLSMSGIRAYLWERRQGKR